MAALNSAGISVTFQATGLEQHPRLLLGYAFNIA